MPDQLRTAIIGCGKVGHLHARALQQLPENTFAAVYSRSLEKATSFAARYGVHAYADLTEMIQQEKIDIAIVCTPHPQHRNPCITAMEAGAHVLVEKPLAVTLDDCDAMIRTAAQTGKQLGVISQRRFFPASLRMKEAITAGKIGRPALGTVLMLGWRDEQYYRSDPWRGSWKQEGGGVLVNQAPHQLDLLQWFMDDEPEELYGIWNNINHPYIEVEDTALALVRFRNGGIANILVSNAQKPGIYARVHIHGTNGASVGVQTDGGAMFIAGVPSVPDPAVNDLWTIPGEEQQLPLWVEEDSRLFRSVDPMEYFLRVQDRDFILAVRDGRKPMVTGTEGRVTAEIFTAIYRSRQLNAPVRWPI